MHNLGFGYWSRTLYFDLSEQPKTQEFVEDEALSQQWLAEQEQKERDFLAHFFLVKLK